MPDPIKTFEAKAPWLMDKLMAEFPWDVLDAAACAGNGGAESGGFTAFQEKNPTVKGSLGGWGWFQWTGPRRRAFMAYCKSNGFDPKGDDAQWLFLRLELKGPESKTIAAVRAAPTLEKKVVAFELNFERAHPKYKHYPSRIRWAERALAAYKARGPKPVPKPGPEPIEPPPVSVEPRAKPTIQLVMGAVVAIVIAIAGMLSQCSGG
jgi:hypothetical protein